MSARADFDPHSAVRALLWRNRLMGWRARPGEAAFLGAALGLAALLLGALLLSQRDNLAAALGVLSDQGPLAGLLALALLAGSAHYRQRRRQRRQWARDWLAAQPVSSPVRRRRRWRDAALHWALQAALTGIVLLLAGLPASLPPALAALLAGALVGQLAADVERRPKVRRKLRETPFVQRGAGRPWRWQLIELSAALAPRRLAILLALATVLVPRGGLWMILPALILLMVLATLAGWQRSVGVIVQAQRWLAEQPLPARRWLPRLGVVPLGLLGASCALAALACVLADHATLAWLLLLPTFALALLHLACVMAHRTQPRRIALAMLIHASVLLAVAQALPLLALPLWLTQLGWLGRRALSTELPAP